MRWRATVSRAWPALFVAAFVAGTAIVAHGQVFSARVDTIRLDVLVKRGDQRVQGLTADDFDVRDNGVPQHVDLVAAEALPVDVLLTLDVSESVQGEKLNRLRAGGLGLLEGLTLQDRAALLTFTSKLTLRSGFARVGPALRADMNLLTESGNTALIDAVQASLVLAESATGRPLVIVFSDGDDTASFLSTKSVEDTVKRSSAVVYAVTTGGSAPFMRDVARLTGGDTLSAESPGKLSDAFARILDEFRHLYLLSYTPGGVPAPGWHDVTVRLKTGPRADIRARPGYLAGS